MTFGRVAIASSPFDPFIDGPAGEKYPGDEPVNPLSSAPYVAVGRVAAVMSVVAGIAMTVTAAGLGLGNSHRCSTPSSL
jgi:hypothetical protein